MNQQGDGQLGLMNNSVVIFIISALVFGGFFLLLDLGLMRAQGLSLLFEG